MHVLIIEDESLAANWLRTQIEQSTKDMTVVAVLDSVSASVDWLQKNQVDLIFSDIHLADGISFSIFERIAISTPIIFTTAYDHYAIRAFQVNSIDYLLKPIDTEALSASIEKYRSLHTNIQPDWKMLVSGLQPKNNYQERFLVSTGQKLKSLPIIDIAYFFADNKLNFVCDTNGRTYILDQTLDKLEQVVDPGTFFRINRQFIVSFGAIQDMLHYSKSRVKLTLHPSTEYDTIVSAERSAAFKAWLNR
ncbi:MAG TPA: LytTR family DNA-binding domain-containing protein [Chitinophagales bacterium]|nr:LytTR family DNA-binding domain-containing protein [Chitinophagales bacterium]